MVDAGDDGDDLKNAVEVRARGPRSPLLVQFKKYCLTVFGYFSFMGTDTHVHTASPIILSFGAPLFEALRASTSDASRLGAAAWTGLAVGQVARWR